MTPLGDRRRARPGREAAAPAVHEVEPARHAININQLAAEVEARHALGLVGLEIDLLEAHAARGHEFFLVRIFPVEI